MVPGPASIGIAKGVNEMELRVAMSFSTPLRFFPIPLCSLNFPVNKANPEDEIMSPPAIFNAFKLIPKKDRIYFPAKKDNNRIDNTSIAVQKAMTARSFFVFS